MSWHRETNPHFRPPPNQDQHSPFPTPAPGVATTPRHQDHQNQPQSEDQPSQQHYQPPRGPLFTQPQPQPQPQPQAYGQGQHFQPAIQDQQTPVPRAKKPKRQDRRYRPLQPEDQEIQLQPSRRQQLPWPREEHSGPQMTEPISPRKQQSRQPQSQGTPSGPQATLPKNHGQPQQPHSAEAAIHQDHHQDNRRQSNGLVVPPPRQTKLTTWFLAGCCAVFWIVIILGGLIVLIVYLLFRPHNPRFDVSSVTLNAAYLDVGVLLNADLTVLANFTNPNRKVRVDFSYVVLDLYYGKTLIASQYVEPFSAARRTSWFTYVHMLTSQVRLPVAETERLKKEIDSNAAVFRLKVVFRARSNLGSFLRYSYLMYSHCTVVLTGPPTGVLRAGKCKTQR